MNLQVAFIAMDFRWPHIARELSRDEDMLNQMKVYIEAKGRKVPEPKDETKGARVKLEENPGLERFLKEPPGKDLLSLDGNELGQLLFYSSITKEKAAEEIIDDVLMTITPQESRILRLRFGLEDGRIHTLQEVSKEFGVTGERIRQIEATAVRKLHHPSRSRRLSSMLGSMSELDDAYQHLLLAVFGLPK